MIEIYQEDDRTQSHRVMKPDAYLLGFGLHAVSCEYLNGYSLHLKAWGLYPVYEDVAWALTYFTKGRVRTSMLSQVKNLEKGYWRYFLAWLLYKKLHLIAIEAGYVFSWKHNFRPLSYFCRLIKEDRWLRI